MASYTGYEAGFSPFTYLGLPISLNMSRIANWQPLIDRFKARSSGWKANLLSIGGRLTLIKFVLGSLGNYYFSIFKVLEMVVKSLKTLRASFFWGSSEDSKKLAWVKWSNILASLDKGGLGVIHGDEACIDIRGCHTNGVWASIVESIFHLHSSSIVPLNSICFKSRPVNVGRTKAKFDAVISDISNLEPEGLVDSDNCIWSISNDEIFLVNSVRKHIDELFLPSLSPICNVYVKSSAYTFFSCDTAVAVWHLVRVWSGSIFPSFSSCGEWDLWFQS
ncbi:hypothetical protein Tco_0232817 [Tanacetum coccineum]